MISCERRAWVSRERRREFPRMAGWLSSERQASVSRERRLACVGREWRLACGLRRPRSAAGWRLALATICGWLAACVGRDRRLACVGRERRLACVGRERRPGFPRESRTPLRRRWRHGTEDAGGALENQGGFGFGQAVRAVGAVCGGSQQEVSQGEIYLLNEILHIPFQPPTSLPQTPQRVLSNHPLVWSVHLSRVVVWEGQRRQRVNDNLSSFF